jgi:adenylate cyclase
MFAVLEFADIAFPRLGLPDDAVDVVLWIGIVGFPVVLFAAWAVELRVEADTGRTMSWVSPTTVATVLALAAVGIAMSWWWGGLDEGEGPPSFPAASGSDPSSREPAVAVLRFPDLGGSEQHAYFAAGLSEEISTALSRFRGIRVIAPSATADFEPFGGEGAIGARERSIAYVLRGSVRRGEERVRVAVQLLDATSGAQVWGDHYDAELATEALFAAQDRMAGKVASAVADSSGVIVRSSRESSRRSRTDRFEAYDCVLLGYAYIEIHTAPVHGAARDCLERAVELDPNYAEAWAHLAYVFREEFHHDFNPKPGSLDRADRAARRAIELDATNPMAHFAMSQIQFSNLDFEAAIASMERAIELNPNDTLVLATMATYLIRVGQVDRGMEMARKTAELNPLHPGWLHTSVGLYHYLRGEFNEALLALARTQYRTDSQTLALSAASQGHLGRPEASATLDALRRSDERFADAPMEELRRYFILDDTVDAVVRGLHLAGLEISGSAPAPPPGTTSR